MGADKYITLLQNNLTLQDLTARITSVIATTGVTNLALTGSLQFKDENTVVAGIRYNGKTLEASVDGEATWLELSTLAWKSGVSYAVGAVVLHNGGLYVCITDTAQAVPGETAKWRLQTSGSIIRYATNADQLAAALAENASSICIVLKGSIVSAVTANVQASHITIYSDEASSIAANISLTGAGATKIYWHADGTRITANAAITAITAITATNCQVFVERLTVANDAALVLAGDVTYQRIDGDVTGGTQERWTEASTDYQVPRDLSGLPQISYTDNLKLYVDRGDVKGYLTTASLAKEAANIAVSQFEIDDTDIFANKPQTADRGYVYYAEDTGDLYIMGNGNQWGPAIHIKGDTGPSGTTGYTYIPSVSASGDLSWTVERIEQEPGIPETVNIKGAKGDSAYDIWIEAGNEGDKDDFLEALGLGERKIAFDHTAVDTLLNVKLKSDYPFIGIVDNESKQWPIADNSVVYSDGKVTINLKSIYDAKGLPYSPAYITVTIGRYNRAPTEDAIYENQHVYAWAAAIGVSGPAILYTNSAEPSNSSAYTTIALGGTAYPISSYTGPTHEDITGTWYGLFGSGSGAPPGDVEIVDVRTLDAGDPSTVEEVLNAFITCQDINYYRQSGDDSIRVFGWAKIRYTKSTSPVSGDSIYKEPNCVTSVSPGWSSTTYDRYNTADSAGYAWTSEEEPPVTVYTDTVTPVGGRASIYNDAYRTDEKGVIDSYTTAEAGLDYVSKDYQRYQDGDSTNRYCWSYSASSVYTDTDTPVQGTTAVYDGPTNDPIGTVNTYTAPANYVVYDGRRYNSSGTSNPAQVSSDTTTYYRDDGNLAVGKITYGANTYSRYPGSDTLNHYAWTSSSPAATIYTESPLPEAADAVYDSNGDIQGTISAITQAYCWTSAGNTSVYTQSQDPYIDTTDPYSYLYSDVGLTDEIGSVLNKEYSYEWAAEQPGNPPIYTNTENPTADSTAYSKDTLSSVLPDTITSRVQVETPYITYSSIDLTRSRTDDYESSLHVHAYAWRRYAGSVVYTASEVIATGSSPTPVYSNGDMTSLIGNASVYSPQANYVTYADVDYHRNVAQDGGYAYGWLLKDADGLIPFYTGTSIPEVGATVYTDISLTQADPDTFKYYSYKRNTAADVFSYTWTATDDTKAYTDTEDPVAGTTIAYSDQALTTALGTITLCSKASSQLHRKYILNIPAGAAPSASVEAITGGARITITDSSGTTTADVMDGTDGHDGYSPTAAVTTTVSGAMISITDKNGTTTADITNGQDGYSPSASVTATANGATISITDKNGTTTANIANGQDGVNAYVYVAWASDAAGTDFSTTPSAQLPFRAELHTSSPIAAPTLADFTGVPFVDVSSISAAEQELSLRHPSTAYASGARSLYPQKAGYVLVCTTAGTTAAALPSWPVSIKSGVTTLIDGTATWTIYDALDQIPKDVPTAGSISAGAWVVQETVEYAALPASSVALTLSPAAFPAGSVVTLRVNNTAGGAQTFGATTVIDTTDTGVYMLTFVNITGAIELCGEKVELTGVS